MSRSRAATAVKAPPPQPSAGSGQFVVINGQRVALSNLNKVLYPDVGFTKAQVIEYYARIAPIILPHLKDRPLTLKRYPNGIAGEFFYEKTCPSHRPQWVNTGDVPSDVKGLIRYCLVNGAATLVWVANLASLELHTLLARMPDIKRPTFMVFDHDPGPGADMLDCIRVALRFRQLLHDLGFQSFAKTSGGKGLHLYVPLNTPVTFDQTKTLSREFARIMERDDPKRITSNMRKSLRAGRVFVDWSQNDEHKTTVCAYSLRARERPTVSMPVTWGELEHAARRRRPESLVFEADAALKRAESHGDLFAPVLRLRQKLPKLNF